MAGGREYDSRKLEELVLHIADRSLRDPRFGKTKLNKILFFSDFTSYLQIGHSITGAVYQHLPQGPCAHQMLPVLASLRDQGDVIVKPEEIYGVVQQRIVATRKASLSRFDSDEIAIVDRVLDALLPLTNSEVSDLSHETYAWRLTEEHQEIPYGTALFSSRSPSEDDMLWLRTVADSRGTVAQT